MTKKEGGQGSSEFSRGMPNDSTPQTLCCNKTVLKEKGYAVEPVTPDKTCQLLKDHTILRGSYTADADRAVTTS